MKMIHLIIPCFNEADRLPETAITTFLQSHPDLSILLVNNGSTDATEDVIKQIQQKNPQQVTTMTLSENRGKCECVRQGILALLEQSSAEWLGFWDADMATDLEELDRLPAFASDSTQMVLCSRVRRLGAVIDRYRLRFYLSRIAATIISLVTKLPVYDSQCGAKLVHRSVAKAIFEKPFLSQWLFDVEMLLRLKALNPGVGIDDTAVEVSVMKWQDVPGSKLRSHHVFRSLIDILRIGKHYRNIIKM
ncbi:MAG: glycosyltransferase [Planctomycetota bacterium]|jgi:glycosyltransferase involved in cell wall biosynthesis